jgi:hypothetical protein
MYAFVLAVSLSVLFFRLLLRVRLTRLEALCLVVGTLLGVLILVSRPWDWWYLPWSAAACFMAYKAVRQEQGRRELLSRRPRPVSPVLFDDVPGTQAVVQHKGQTVYIPLPDTRKR